MMPDRSYRVGRPDGGTWTESGRSDLSDQPDDPSIRRTGKTPTTTAEIARRMQAPLTLLARLRNQPACLAGLATIIVLALLAFAAPVVARDNPLQQDLSAQFLHPSLRHFFGTDEFGRDIFSRVIYGGRSSLLTGGAATLLAALAGVPLGLVAGYLGKWVDAVIMRFLDFLLAIPAILLAMVIIVMLGRGALNAMIAVAIISVPAFARLTRAQTLALKEQEFVLAARSIGARQGHLMFRTILPNAFNPLIVQMAVTASFAMLLEAALSFLGLGIRPPTPSWGSMLSVGRSFLHQAPWYSIFPGLTITLTVLALNGLADGLQTALDRDSARGAARSGG